MKSLSQESEGLLALLVAKISIPHTGWCTSVWGLAACTCVMESVWFPAKHDF